jgi:putative aldouronate transport system substrate-binding protein
MEDLGTRRSAPARDVGSDLSRRRLLGLFGIGAAATVIPGALASCSSGGGGGAAEPVTTAQINSALPNYYPLNLVQPDYPSVSGSTAGFSKMPATLADAVTAPPGKGGTYTAMTPAWWTAPPGL